MGRGNVCVHGQFEGLYYIDADDYSCYVRADGSEDVATARDLDYDDMFGKKNPEWEYAQVLSEIAYDEILSEFTSQFAKRFPSFSKAGPDQWISRTQRAILESKLFYVCVEDNQWSTAVELIQRDDVDSENLQGRHYQSYLKGMRDILLELLPSIGVYTGAWTSGTITRENLRNTA